MKRAGFNSLRAARIGVPLFAIVSMSLFFSLLHSQPANAEGFLDRTLRCTVGALLGAQCPNTPEQVVTPVTPTATPTAGPSTSSPSPTQAQPAPTPQPSKAQVNTAQPVQMAPLAVELAQTQKLPSFPSTTSRNTVPAWTAFANSYGQGRAATDLGDSALQPSQDGWRILGVSWYWWGIGIVATALVTRLFMRRYSINDTVAS
ncbi:MAG: hypothetical protein JWN28_119 [Candidatus Saccharibacteria bacterium]|nr:hypothetical protein [Candidatus Saccharibacteria bacterium]